jgi:hypothetical protein
MLDNLGNVLALMTVVVVVGCGAWGLAARIVGRRRAAVVRREFALVPDEQLLLGLAELRRDVLAQQQSEQARDMHVRYWR